MKNLILTILCLGSTASYAAKESTVISLRVDFMHNDGEIHSATLLTRVGNAATVMDEKISKESAYAISAVPTETKTREGKRAVDVKFTISAIGKDGKKSVVAQPEVLVLDGETATVSQTEKNGESLTLTVTPKIL